MLGEYIGKETKEGGYDYGQILGDLFIFDTLNPAIANCVEQGVYSYEGQMLYFLTENYIEIVTRELNHK